jgi:DNA-binding GntR family transcriptional regulator
VLQEVVDTHLLLASRQPGMTSLPAAALARVVRSYRKLIALVEAQDAAGAEAHWRTHMAVAARSLLPDELKSATVLDIFS